MRFTLKTFRRIAELENAVARATMPRTPDPKPAVLPTQYAAVAVTVDVLARTATSRLVRPTSYRMQEVARA